METPPEQKPPIQKRKTFSELLKIWYKNTLEWFDDLLDLREGMDRLGTIKAIKNNKRMRGANAWLLMCSIMIASIGLDLNSAAVIIGAMLISPLMAPILGIGLAVGTNDKDALYLSLRHFGIAIIIALFTSTFYFLITPLGQPTAQILMRTEPTFLDGLVAVFGGLAGIISTSRKDASNAIPGVAIATALMPPLCVTGYGIVYGFRTGEWDVMLNSFYLFFLNSFFIALTTYLMIRVMQFPLKDHVNEKENRRTRWIVTIFSLIIIIPSANILIRLYEDRQVELKAEAFVKEYFDGSNGTNYIDYDVIHGDTSHQLVLRLLGNIIKEDSLATYYKGMEEYGLNNTDLTLIQDSDIELQELNKMKLEISQFNRVADQLNAVNKSKSEKEAEIDTLRMKIDSLTNKNVPFEAICEEAKAVFPKLNSIAFAKVKKTDFEEQIDGLPVFLITWDRNKTRSERRRDEKKLYDFLKVRSKLDTIDLITY